MKPNFSRTSGPGADAPKRSIETCSSAQRSQPIEMAASTDTVGTSSAEHVVLVVLVLLLEELPARHRDDAHGEVEQVGGLQCDPDLGARGDDDRLGIVLVAQHVGPLRDARGLAELVAVEHRQVLPRQDERGGALEVLDDEAPGLGRLRRVRRAQHDEARDRPERREVLDRLVGRAVLAQRDGVVRPDPRDRQARERREAHGAAHVVGELQERRPVRTHDAAVGGQAVHRAAHAVLAHAEEHVAARVVAGEPGSRPGTRSSSTRSGPPRRRPSSGRSSRRRP